MQLFCTTVNTIQTSPHIPCRPSSYAIELAIIYPLEHHTRSCQEYHDLRKSLLSCLIFSLSLFLSLTSKLPLFCYFHLFYRHITHSLTVHYKYTLQIKVYFRLLETFRVTPKTLCLRHPLTGGLISLRSREISVNHRCI